MQGFRFLKNNASGDEADPAAFASQLIRYVFRRDFPTGTFTNCSSGWRKVRCIATTGPTTRITEIPFNLSGKFAEATDDLIEPSGFCMIGVATNLIAEGVQRS